MKHNKEDLLEALRATKPALSKQEFLPVLTHYCFDTETVTAYNDVLALQIRLDTDINAAVPGEDLLRLLSTISAEDVVIEQEDTSILVKYGKKGKTRLATLPASEFVWEPPEEDSEHGSFQVNAVFLNQLRRCVKTIGNDATRPVENGVSLIKSGNKFKLFSTDNTTLSCAEVRLSDVTGEFPESLLIPAEFCEALVSMVELIGDSAIIYYTDDWLLADVEEMAYVFCKISSDYTAYKFEEILEKFTKNASGKTVPIPEQFTEAVLRAKSMIHGIEDPLINIVVDSDSVEIKGSSNTVDIDDTIEGTFGEFEEPLEFTVDPNLLARAETLCPNIQFSEDVTIFSDTNFVHLVSHARQGA